MTATISDYGTTYRMGRLVLTTGVWLGIEFFRTAGEADEWEAYVHTGGETAEPAM